MYDIHSGEWVGPNCPCDEAGEWVPTCDLHLTDPTIHNFRIITEPPNLPR